MTIRKMAVRKTIACVSPRSLLFATVLTLVGGIFTSALAQTPAPALSNPEPSAASIASAKELIAMKGGVQMFDGMTMGVIESAKNALLPSNPNLAKPLSEVTAQLRAEYEPKKAEVNEQVARAYAKHFTEAELKDLVTFYKTPLGKKMLTEEALAVEDGFKRAQDWSIEFSDQVIARFRVEMKKKGYDL